jgi:hypothetical protein
MKSFYPSFILLFLLSGCSVLLGQVKPVEEKSVNSSPKNSAWSHPDWKKLEISTNADSNGDLPDSAWQSSKTAAVISLNSVCRKEKSEGKDLKAVTRVLLSQWDHLKILGESSEVVSGLPAFSTVATGHYLGRERKFKVLVVKTPTCVFDLVFLSPVKTFDQDISIFQQFHDNLVLK